MRILLTGENLACRAGTEEATRRLARALQSRGHLVMVYGSDMAQIRRIVEHDRIPLADDPAALPVAPDIIHACNPHDALSALMALPGVPAVFQSSQAMPAHPRVLRRFVVSTGPTTDGSPAFHVPGEWPDREMDRLLELYQAVIRESHALPADWAAEARAIVEYLRQIHPRLIETDRALREDWTFMDRFLWGRAMPPAGSATVFHQA